MLIFWFLGKEPPHLVAAEVFNGPEALGVLLLGVGWVRRALRVVERLFLKWGGGQRAVWGWWLAAAAAAAAAAMFEMQPFLHGLSREPLPPPPPLTHTHTHILSFPLSLKHAHTHTTRTAQKLAP